MALEEHERIIIPNEEGEEELYEILYRFNVDDTEKSYIAVIPVDQKDEEQVDLFAFRYEETEDDDDIELYPIDSDEEWDIIEETLNTLVNQDEPL